MSRCGMFYFINVSDHLQLKEIFFNLNVIQMYFSNLYFIQILYRPPEKCAYPEPRKGIIANSIYRNQPRYQHDVQFV